ncbi:MAG: exodeoxyribonuclease I [Arenicellales bacterium]
MSQHTFFWHDYETFGINPSWDRPAQFAGIRTDDQLQAISDPLVIYCKPAPDVLPTPDACLVTGITPQIASVNGVVEAEFIAKIHQQLALPGTCGAGFNSIRFDDEVTRYTLYRNFFDPYAREYQYDCSRWDIIDLARMTFALRPDGVEWPRNDTGVPSFKLENLAAANGISHDSAHDALSDVSATIEFAKLLRSAQPKLFDWLFTLRNKHKVAQQIDVRSGKPIVHTTRMYPSSNGCTSLVMPLIYESRNKSSVLVYDLRYDPEEFLDLDSEALYHRLFTPVKELSESDSRLPVKSLKINHCPAIAPINTINDRGLARINLDLDLCARHREKILTATTFAERVEQAYSSREFELKDDVDQALYSGFFTDHDKKQIQRVHNSNPDEIATAEFMFNDSRLPELLFRYRARNWPQSLNSEEAERWKIHCTARLHDPAIGLESYFERIDKLREMHLGQKRVEGILSDLESWADSLLSV